MEEVKVLDPYGFIYITTNMINGKKYIGQKMFNKNWQYYLGSGTSIKRAISKYGRQNFSREIISIAYSKEELNELEIQLIELHDAVISNNYYNIVGGGGSNAGFTFSEESRNKLSNSLKGTLKSNETKLKMSQSHKGEKSYMFGNKKSKETRQKISNAKKGENNYNYGKKFSEEYRKKLSDARISLNKKQLIEIREKYLTGKYTQKQLMYEYDVSRSVISNVINFKGVYTDIIV